MLKYAQEYIRYVVKDWKGITDENDKELKCELVGDELKEDLWWALVEHPEVAMNFYLVVSPELEFDEEDKKKLSSLRSWQETANSQEEEKNTQ